MSNPEDHYCLICERSAGFGFKWPEFVNGARVQVYHWYCRAHREIGAKIAAEKRKST